MRSSTLARVAAIMLATYLLIGWTMGSVLSHFIPAMNLKGVAYYAVTWPGFIAHGSGLTKWSPPIPAWSFTFEEGK